MSLAWIDTRPLIGVAMIPIAVILGFVLWRYTFRSSSWIVCQIASFAMTCVVYQFILYGPFIDQKRVITVPVTVILKPDIGPDVIEFDFPDGFGFGNIISKDSDVAKHIKGKSLRHVNVGVELTYDFGKVRGMDLGYAYVDGILFDPLVLSEIRRD